MTSDKNHLRDVLQMRCMCAIREWHANHFLLCYLSCAVFMYTCSCFMNWIYQVRKQIKKSVVVKNSQCVVSLGVSCGLLEPLTWPLAQWDSGSVVLGSTAGFPFTHQECDRVWTIASTRSQDPSNSFTRTLQANLSSATHMSIHHSLLNLPQNRWVS